MQRLAVIIADDDQLVLNDLKQIVDWEHLGFTIAGMASNGDDALTLIRKYHPALLITDIRMIGMDGLELIEIAHKEFPNMKFLIISSYHEFDYAKRAIASGVMDYLLKTEITAAALTQKLLETISYFQNEEYSNRAVYEREFSQFLSSPGLDFIDSVQFPHLSIQQNTKYYFSLITYTHMFSRDISKTLQEESFHLQGAKDIILNFAKGYCAMPIICICKDYIILGMPKDISIYQPLNALRDFRNRLMPKLNRTGNSYIQFYLLRHMTILKFCAYYRTLIPFIDYYRVFYPDQPINLESLKGNHHLRTDQPFPFHALIFDEDHQEENILLIKDYISKCCDGYDIYSLMTFYSNFCTHMEITSNNQKQLPLTLHAPLPEYFQKWLYNTLYECILLRTRGLEYKYSPVVDSAIQFMIQNCANSGLSAADISHHVGLSSNRLGVLFKKDTGKTVNEHLSHIRVDKAIHLLEKTNMKIYEISDKCGYKSSQYFSQIIYQKTGRRPIDFRKAVKP